MKHFHLLDPIFFTSSGLATGGAFAPGQSLTKQIPDQFWIPRLPFRQLVSSCEFVKFVSLLIPLHSLRHLSILAKGSFLLYIATDFMSKNKRSPEGAEERQSLNRSCCESHLPPLRKSEIRNPKSEIPQRGTGVKVRKLSPWRSCSGFGFLSDFGFRISDLAPSHPPVP